MHEKTQARERGFALRLFSLEEIGYCTGEANR